MHVETLAVEGERAVVGAHRAREDFHKCALAGAVLPDQRVHLAAEAGEVRAAERLHAAERLLDVGEDERTDARGAPVPEGGRLLGAPGCVLAVPLHASKVTPAGPVGPPASFKR